MHVFPAFACYRGFVQLFLEVYSAWSAQYDERTGDMFTLTGCGLETCCAWSFNKDDFVPVIESSSVASLTV
jgi:hypothetical protein